MREEFKNFDCNKSRVDEFLRQFLCKSKFLECVEICKIIFTLSHSQCAVERGFSVNKELLVESLEELSLTSQRYVYDHVRASKKDLHEFSIIPGLFKSCKQARSKYFSHLEKKKAEATESAKLKKRQIISEEISDVK